MIRTASRTPPARRTLPPPGAPLGQVLAFWEEMIEHPDSPWLVPALTTKGMPVPVIASAAPGYALMWAEEVLGHDGVRGRQAERRVRGLVQAGVIPLASWHPHDPKFPTVGMSLIGVATARRRVSLVEWLVDQGAACPSSGAVYQACLGTAQEAFRLLKALQRIGADFTDWGAAQGFEELLKRLPAVGEKPWVLQAVDVLLDAGMPPVHTRRTPENTHHWTPRPIFGALATWDMDVLKRVVARTDPKDMAGSIGHALLRDAVFRLQLPQVEFLLKAGTPPKEPTTQTTTLPHPTLLAEFVNGCRVRRERDEMNAAAAPRPEPDLRIMDVLLEAGLRTDDGNVDDPSSPTALHLAMGLGWLELLKRLLPTSKKAIESLWRFRTWAQMAVRWPVAEEIPAVWGLLMEAGMDPMTPSSLTGESPLCTALKRGDEAEAAILMEMMAPSAVRPPRIRL